MKRNNRIVIQIYDSFWRIIGLGEAWFTMHLSIRISVYILIAFNIQDVYSGGISNILQFQSTHRALEAASDVLSSEYSNI
jgi:hypothetical protein